MYNRGCRGWAQRTRQTQARKSKASEMKNASFYLNDAMIKVFCCAILRCLGEDMQTLYINKEYRDKRYLT